MEQVFKMDCHCHTHEGSPDSKVSIEEYISILVSKGLNGMLVTDHDSYKGYNYYRKHQDIAPEGFVVLKGVEYDTFDAGHFIVVMPTGFDSPLLEHQGMKLNTLIDYVHKNGGIIGPAHGFGEPFLSVFRTGRHRRDYSMANKLDFIEGFNSCEFEKDNEKAKAVAADYGIPVTGGSDAHWKECVGEGYTIFEEIIKTEDDFISYIISKKPTEALGNRFKGTLRDRLGIFNKILVYSFFPYNKWNAFVHTPGRLICKIKNK